MNSRIGVEMKIKMNNKCRNELISALENENQFRNELQLPIGNEPEMNFKNELEMNAGNEQRKNRRNEPTRRKF